VALPPITPSMLFVFAVVTTVGIAAIWGL